MIDSLKILLKNIVSPNLYKTLKTIYIQIKELIKFLISIFYFPFAIIVYLLNVKFISVVSNRIGHLIHDTEIEIKNKILNENNYKIIVLLSSEVIANEYVLTYLNQYVDFVRNNFLKIMLHPFLWIKFTTLDTKSISILQEGTSRFTKIVNEWDDRKPLFEISNEDRKVIYNFLTEHGLNRENWYVCIHNRTSNYSLAETGDQHDYDQSFRNNSLANYELALKEIVKRGGWIIRMGIETEEEIPIVGNIIDYANYNNKSDKLDMLLYGSCKFLLCSTSGIISLSNMFGVPAAITNVTPLSHIFLGPKYNICIGKLYKKNNEFLKFYNILGCDIGNYRYTESFEKNDIEVIENSKDEIHALVNEMFSKINLESNIDTVKVEDLRNKFKKLFDSSHYTYDGKAKVSNYFLEKYKKLVE